MNKDDNDECISNRIDIPQIDRHIRYDTRYICIYLQKRKRRNHTYLSKIEKSDINLDVQESPLAKKQLAQEETQTNMYVCVNCNIHSPQHHRHHAEVECSKRWW